MKKDEKFLRKLEPLFDTIGEILAVALVVIWVLSLANAQWGFIKVDSVLFKIISIIRNYGALVLVAVVGLEAMCKRSFILRLIFYILCAIIVIFLFFPGTYANLISRL